MKCEWKKYEPDNKKTHPKEGRYLIYSPTTLQYKMYICRFGQDRWLWEGEVKDPINPEYWAELPAPPK